MGAAQWSTLRTPRLRAVRSSVTSLAVSSSLAADSAPIFEAHNAAYAKRSRTRMIGRFVACGKLLLGNILCLRRGPSPF